MISMQYTSLSKAMIIQAGWIKAVIISSWEETWPFFHSNKLESSLPKISMCQVWKKLAQWFWRRFLKWHLSVLAILLLSPLFEMGCLFIWTNLYPLHPRIFYYCIGSGYSYYSFFFFFLKAFFNFKFFPFFFLNFLKFFVFFLIFKV